MIRSTKIIIFVLVLVFIVSSIAGCGLTNGSNNVADDKTESSATSSEDSSPASIVWTAWVDESMLAKCNEFTANFNKAHPNITTKFQGVPYDGYEQKMLTSLAAGTAPDVFYIIQEGVQKFIKGERILDLSGYMAKSVDLKPDSFYDNLYGASKQDGKIFGVPIDCNAEIIYYNSDLLKTMGIKTPQEYLEENKWDINAFIEICNKVRDNGKMAFIFENWWPFTAFYLDRRDLDFFSSDGKSITITDPENVKGLQQMSDLIKSKAVVYEGALAKGQGAGTMFPSGQLAMVANDRGILPLIKDACNFNWDIAPFPKTQSGYDRTALMTAYIAINKDCKYPEAAFTFIEEYCNKEGQLFRMKDGFATPSYKDKELDQTVLIGDVPAHSEYFLKARDTGHVLNPGAQLYPAAQKAIYDTLDLLWLGKIDAETAAQNAYDRATAEIEKSNK